ncbi:jupiter microtubule associated homolog 2-like [Mobula hypostoma]|uniref:jupiter microtubule associated homolog 2-like n=1 Tax=Mobula hypostoma TaxID=723540 RepID=UPI002FC2C8A1
MSKTTTNQDLDSKDRSSSRVMQPPGGESSISLGLEENAKPVHSRPSKTASNIFGPPLQNQPVARRRNPPGGKSSGIFQAATTETPDLKQRRNPPAGKTSGICDIVEIPPKTPDIATGEGENSPGSSETENQMEAQGKKGECVPGPVESAQTEPVRRKRVPPGGWSTIVLG